MQRSRRVSLLASLVTCLLVCCGLVAPAAQAATATRLTLSSSVRGPADQGDDGHYKARLKTSSGQRLGGRPVALWGRGVGETTWQKLATGRTMRSGLALFTVPSLSRTIELQARFKGGNGYRASRSAVFVQQVRATVSGLDVTPQDVYSGDQVTVTASTSGLLAGGEVVVERYQALEWVEVGRGTVGGNGTIAVTFPAGDPQYDADTDSYRPQTHRVRTLPGALASGSTDFLLTPRPWGIGDLTILRSAGEQIDLQIEAQGGTAPLAFQVVAGELPPGVTVSSSGLVSGSSGQKGLYVATVRVTDAVGRADTGELTINVSGNDIVITTSSFPDAALGQYYEEHVEVQGAVGAVEFVIEGLPDGLGYAQDGTVYGVPDETGDFPVRVHVFDSDNNYSTKEIPLRVVG